MMTAMQVPVRYVAQALQHTTTEGVTMQRNQRELTALSRKLRSHRVIDSIDLNAHDWRLFDIAGSESAARRLNARFKAEANQSEERSFVLNAMTQHMSALADFGADRKEAVETLNDLLDIHFGRNSSSGPLLGFATQASARPRSAPAIPAKAANK